jgi:chemotaxis protein MotB
MNIVLRRASRTALLLALVLGSGACVAQTRYDAAVAETRYYQRQYQDLSSYQGQLEAENARLKGELDLYQGKQPIDAAATRDIDERLERLKRITESVGTVSGDITVVPVEGGYGLRVADAILFDLGSAEIKPEGRDVLTKIVQQISSQPYERIWVRGHTDSLPVKQASTLAKFPHGNLQLSAARAVEVAALLTTSGIDTARVVVAGFGPSEPVAANDTAENRKLNRRVEIFVLDSSAEDAGR